MKTFFVYTDGGASGNPGPAGIGVVIKSKTILEISEYIGETTNNQAEYKALLRAQEELLTLKENGESEYRFFLDSELLVCQLNLKYKVKHKELQPLFLKAKNNCVLLGNVSFCHIEREQNKEADSLVKAATKKR